MRVASCKSWAPPLDRTAAAPCVQRRVRDARAGYVQSLEVLRAAKAAGVLTKSSLMLGLGEADDEVIDAMLDLRAAGASQCKVSNHPCTDGRFCHAQPAPHTALGAHVRPIEACIGQGLSVAACAAGLTWPASSMCPAAGLRLHVAEIGLF